MAHYIVLRVGDSEVLPLLKGVRTGDYSLLQVPLESGTVKVLGLFRRPTQICSCAVAKPNNIARWSRGAKFGWMVCQDCHRPSKWWLKGVQLRLEQALGRNLLKGG